MRRFGKGNRRRRIIFSRPRQKKEELFDDAEDDISICVGDSDRETTQQFIGTLEYPVLADGDMDSSLVKMGEHLDNAHYWSAIGRRDGRLFRRWGNVEKEKHRRRMREISRIFALEKDHLRSLPVSQR